jgi:uncharacterized protein (TIGR02246 family)
MWRRNIRRLIVAPALVVVAWALAGPRDWTANSVRAQAGAGSTRAPQQASKTAAAPKPTSDAAAKAQSDGEKAILAVDDAYALEFNKGDSKALAAYFTEDAEIVEAEGDRYLGRESIEKRFAETFAANPGAKIAIETDEIRFLSPEVAKEDGRCLVTPAKGAPEESSFTVLYVKRAGRWLISSVREDLIDSSRPHDRLKDLEWMIGEWVEERPDSTVRLTCRWSDDENFLLRFVTVKREGKPVMSISQRIGWDPLAHQVRSWEFDAAGGFGEGRWSRDGDRWVIKHTGVQPDGVTVSATNVMTKERPDLVRWVSTDQVVGDELMPEANDTVLVRVPPPPGVKSNRPPNPTPAANATRNKR